MTYQLGILNQSPILEGASVTESLHQTVLLAKLADDLGFSRYWVAEHHNTLELAGSSPEILATHILANTSRIRVGSGGVMLQHYEPYKVAENFNVLAALHGNRVDVGVGNGPGGLINERPAISSFDEKLGALQKYIEKDTKEQQPLKATPLSAYEPQLHLPGASRNSAHLATKYSLPYAFAQFFNETEDELREASAIYQRGEQPNKHFIVAVSVVVTDNPAEKEHYSKPTTFVKATFQNGKIITFKSEEQARAFSQPDNKIVTINKQTLVPIVGTVEEVEHRLDELKEQYAVNEFLIHLASLKRDVRTRTITELSKLIAKIKV